MDYTFFKNYKEICDLLTLKPSKEVGHPYVNNIRQLRYKSDSTIKFNLTYKDEHWEKLPHEFTLRHVSPAELYNSPIKISYLKWLHLQDLKVTIPEDCHAIMKILIATLPNKIPRKTIKTLLHLLISLF